MVKEDKLMKKLSVLAGIAAVFCVSCQQEIEVSVDGLKTISSIEAIISEAPRTKARIGDGYKYDWDYSEEIGVFADSGAPVLFSKSGNDNIFYSADSQSVSGSQFYGYYPYRTITQDPENPMLLHFAGILFETGKDPYFQLPMVAKSDGSSLSFRHTCGILHFTITGTQTLTSIYLTANGDEPIIGSATIDLSESTPVLKREYSAYSSTNAQFFWNHIQLSKEEPLDVWYLLPPMTLKRGFTITIGYEGGNGVTKSTDKAVTISRATVTSFALLDMDELIEEAEAQDGSEREALIALYNATDGPNWVNNTNWCSDKPLNEWYGVTADGNDHVGSLYLEDNALVGPIPAEFSKLVNLKDLRITQTNGHITNIDPVFDISGLTTLIYGVGRYWSLDEYESVRERMLSIPSGIGKLKNLRSLTVIGIKEDLPEELFNLELLQHLNLEIMQTGKPLPTGFGKLQNLRILGIGGLTELDVPGANPVCGTLPDDFYDLKHLAHLSIVGTAIGGELSPRIGELQELEEINLQLNKFSGPLPAELTTLSLIEKNPGIGLWLANNNFSGKVPEAFRTWKPWQLQWGYIVNENRLDFSEVMPSIPDFEVRSISGENISSAVVSDHELTLLFQWASWCPWSPSVIAGLKNLYPQYKDKGLEVVSYSYEDAETVRSFATENGFPWPTFANCKGAGQDNYPLGIEMYPLNSFPSLTIFDSSGRLVYYQFGSEDGWKDFIQDRLDQSSSGPYESTDYSADGTVHTLQTASRGAGIDIVLMGDAFSDRLIADGSYAARMQQAADVFFSEEPYRSYRDCFNVYYVDVVSKNERWNKDTALGTWFGEGTAVGGNDAKVLGYARKAVPDSRMDDAALIVVINRDYYAGTCYMYNSPGGDYGRGLSISYFPANSYAPTFSSLVSHEAGGHGFAKLGDEYYYVENGTIPEDMIASARASEPYGWWKNVDFTSDPSEVKWAAFIADSRYVAERIGVYQGAYTYPYGAWRPTRNSIMSNNSGGFNAPSRYAIWYRINKLAFGSAGSYEDFVSYDAVNRTPSAVRRKAMSGRPGKEFEPLAPPVVVSKDWRQLVSKR